MSQRAPVPIAIIGAGCRLPGGANDLHALDLLLRDGVDAVREVPASRWSTLAYWAEGSGVPGKTYSRWGGFLDNIDQFEPEAFGISAREAAVIDPQHRLLLEVVWEALQDAGIPLREVAGSRTGVFIGISTFDYSQLQASGGSKRSLQSFTALGTSLGIAANRISYCLDARGPSFIVDTACSSALVAVDRAVRSLRSGECDMAIAGGVNVILLPDVFVSFSAAQMLSPDGRCKAFDATANGFVRGEGAGAIVLRTAASARARGDRVHALVLGSGINQDGRTTGLAMPNREAQVALLREVYGAHRIDPATVGYVEAHGTGTTIGDRVEANSLGEVFSAGRKHDLAIGSVKTNIGHLEAGSGMAGLLKAMLSLKHQTIYRSLHFRTPNPRIPFDEYKLRVPTETERWAQDGETIAGVNSFGFGGTNAHVILAAGSLPAARRRARPVGRRPYLLPVTARSEAALAEVAGSFAAALRAGPAEVAAFCRTAALRRTHYGVRVCMVGKSREALAARLEEFAAGERGAWARTGTVRAAKRPLVFVFAGQGTQYAGMGLDLMEREPAFREMVERCNRTLAPLLGWSVIEELARTKEASRIDETLVAQPALFTIEMGLAALWASWGVNPDAVIGHSVGEVAAACASGALDLEDACKVVAVRGRTMQEAERGGKMLAVALAQSAVEPYVMRSGGRISVAAVNAPKQVTLSGDAAAMHELACELDRAGIQHRSLRVSHAFHSAAMDSAEAPLRAGLEGVSSRAPRVRLVSTVTGGNVQAGELDAAYWWRNVRQPVLFEAAAGQVAKEAAPVFIEVGPQAAMAPALAETARELSVPVDVWPSMRREADGTETIYTTAASLFACGIAMDWNAIVPGNDDPVELPPHPWRRERYWSENPEAAEARVARHFHPLLGIQRSAAVATWEQTVDPKVLSWLSDHCVKGSVVLPAAAYIEMMMAAVGQARHVDEPCDATALCLENIQFQRALFVQEDTPPSIQVTVSEEDHKVDIHSRAAVEAPWNRNATADWSTANPPRPERADLEALRRRCSEPVSVGEAQSEFLKFGLEYGPAFQASQEMWRGDGEALARIEVNDAVSRQLEGGYWWHPVVLDACFQLSPVPSPEEARRSLKLPVRVDQVRVWSRAPGRVWCHLRLRSSSAHAVTTDISVLDESGAVIGEVSGFRVQQASAGTVEDEQPKAYTKTWLASPLAAAQSPASGTWLIFSDSRGLHNALGKRLSEAGATPVFVRRGEGFGGDAETGFTVNPRHPADFDRLLETVKARNVAHLWSRDAGEVENAADHFDDDTGLSVESPLYLMQALARQGGAASVALVHSGRANAAGLAGLSRVALNEFRDWQIKLIEFPEQYTEQEIEGLASEIAGEDREFETAWRGGERFLPRLVEEPASEAEFEPAVGCNGFGLKCEHGGSLDAAHWVREERRPPASGELEIEVQRASLNFRDVLKCIGLYPANSREELALGDECAGVVTGLGSGVTGFELGDRVATCFPGSFRSHLNVPEAMVLRIPDGWEMNDAATIPVAFLTASYALFTVGRLAAGETVLIHAAAGGVGLAAVQLARKAGARVFATAGAEEKRALLRERGCELVMDSRSLEFAREIREYTGGRGVDVVLNSLAGEALIQSAGCLAPYGRFLEIGKRDLFANSRIGLWAMRNNASFHAIDLGAVLREKPDEAARLMNGLREALRAGTIEPLPYRLWPASEIGDALRTMSQGKHTGKLVIDVRDPALQVRSEESARVRFKPDATYVISGGLSGFGLETAKWMARRGAKHIVTLSRRGAETEEARAACAELRASGAEALAITCDVSDRARVDEVMRHIAETLPPVRGVFHAAAVIEDGAIVHLDAGKLRRVLQSKALGAWNLHEATRSFDLDYFVLFSSVSATVGNPGQANYAAANAILEALVSYRRSRGLAGTAIAWSLVSDTGAAAARPEVMKSAGRHGFRTSTSAEYLKVLDRLLTGSAHTAVVGVFDWKAVASSLPRAAMGLLSPLIEEMPREAARSGSESRIREQLSAALAAERASVLREYVRSTVARVVGVSAAKLDMERPIVDLGLDSLMAVELSTALEEGLRTSVPALSNARNVTVEGLVQDIFRQLGYGEMSVPAQMDVVRVLRNGGSRPPLICFHPIGGGLRTYEALIGSVNAEIPIYGVHSRMLNGTREYGSLDEMTRAYTEAVMQSVPEGPWRLFGFSLGGYLAARVAQELEAAGREVDFVGVADCADWTRAPGAQMRDHLARMLLSSYEDAAADLTSLRPLDERHRAAFGEIAGVLIESREQGPEKLLTWLSESGLMDERTPKKSMRELVERLAAHLLLFGSSAIIPKVRSPLVVWQASRGVGAGPEVWTRTDGLQTTAAVIDADHATVMKSPAVLVIAHEINRVCGAG